MATATAAPRTPEDLANRYDRLAKSTGRTKTFYMTEALAAEIGRLEYEYGLMNYCVSSRGFEQKEHRKLSSLSIGSAHAF